MQKKRLALSAATLCGLALFGAQAVAHDEYTKSSKQVKQQKSWGIAADPKPGLRTIRLVMSDRMRFIPDTITVHEGETVRLLVRNEGRLMHEFILGTKQDLDEHAALMKKFPTMEHDEPFMTHVQPGKTGAIVWTFNRAGQFDFGCLVPGHYDAGMAGKINVIAHKPPPSSQRAGQE